MPKFEQLVYNIVNIIIGVNLKNKFYFKNISRIAYIRVINKSLEFFILWEPRQVFIEKYYKGLKYLIYTIINDNDSIVLVYWEPTWEPPINLLYNKI